jgi:2-haloacid dehalogenase
MTQISAVVFDIGKVLIDWTPERFYDGVIGADRRRAMYAAIDLDGMNDKVDLGENFYDTIAAVAKANPDFHDDVMMWHDRWIEMVPTAIDRSVRVLRALRTADVSVFALSNFGIETFDIAKTVYPFLTEFDRSYISGHMGVIKPDAQIYQMLEADCGHDPASLLFVDDRIENITAARTRGWQTHVFTGADGWADRLVAEGLLTMEDAQ